MIKQAGDRQSERRRKIKKTSVKDFEALEKEALGNMDKAVNFIMERIVTTDGNSCSHKNVNSFSP